MSFSIPTLRGFTTKSSAQSVNFFNLCLLFSGTENPDFFLINGNPPVPGFDYPSPVDVTFLYNELFDDLKEIYGVTSISYLLTRAGPRCDNISIGPEELTENTTFSNISNPCDDNQTITLTITVQNSNGWINAACCIPHSLLCEKTFDSSIVAYYAFDIEPGG